MTQQNKPPVIHETELTYEGGPGPIELFQQCNKTHGHKNFIPVRDFTMDHLPPDLRTEEMMADIDQYCDRTIRVTAHLTSSNRPDFYPNTKVPYPHSEDKGRYVIRFGTGHVRYTLPSGLVEGQRCPCPYCRKSGTAKKTFLFVTVTTAAHVVFNDEEAEWTKCELFFNSNDRKGVKTLYGINKSAIGDSISNAEQTGDSKNDIADLIENCAEDRTLMTCVTHDPELIALLPRIHSKFEFETPPLPIMVIHPHGFIKHISITGRILGCFVLIPPGYSKNDIHTIGPGSKCRLIATCNSIGSEFFKIVNSIDTSGTNFVLKEGITLSLPPNADCLCQYVPTTESNNPNTNPYDKTYSKRYPSGTTFTYKNIPDSFMLPEVEFYEENGKSLTFPKGSSYYLTYSMDTCRGCSGAPVRTGFDRYPLYWDSHTGALEDGVNVSGVHSPRHINY